MDTRALFSRHVGRKPENWHGVPQFTATPEQREALKTKPVIQVRRERRPGHVTITKLPEGEYELVILRGPQAYYANTEGYHYPRYLGRIANMTSDDFNG